MIELIQGDCNKIEIKNKYDFVISDLPYNTNFAKWDKGVKPNEVFNFNAKGFVLFCVQPLTSELVLGNIKKYKYDIVWRKNTYKSNSFKTRVGRQHETILIFGDLPYNPQMVKRTDTEMKRLNYEQRKKYGYKNPSSVIDFDAINNRNGSRTGHPCEKPIELMEWLIKTYTNEGDTIFDPYMGSGTTAIACMNTNRNFIGVELDEHYFAIAKKRVEEKRKEKENVAQTLFNESN
jgi:site-specific DNA-methyltransferase (adenine-specific)